jgi:aryl-alcohol dehydrogenase
VPGTFSELLRGRHAAKLCRAALLDGQKALATRGVLGYVSATREPFIAPLFPLLLEYWRQGRFPVRRLVTTFPFAQFADAFAACRDGTAIKPVLKVADV